MTVDVPDEILEAVFSEYSYLSTTQFFSNLNISSPSFFTSRPVQPNPSLLLVCRRWYRVAKPLWYTNVIIKTTAQADALHRSITANPLNFSLVKRIRVEIGLGYPAVDALLRFAGPNIQDICLRALCMHSDSGSSSPLLKSDPGALRGVNPLRLAIVDDAHGTERAAVASALFVDHMHAALEKGAWNRLTSVYLPYQAGSSPFYTYGTVGAILDFPTLCTVHLPSNFEVRTIAIPLGNAGKIRGVGLQKIVIHGPEKVLDMSLGAQSADMHMEYALRRMELQRERLRRWTYDRSEKLRELVLFQDTSVEAQEDEWIPCTCDLQSCQLFPLRTKLQAGE